MQPMQTDDDILDGMTIRGADQFSAVDALETTVAAF